MSLETSTLSPQPMPSRKRFVSGCFISLVLVLVFDLSGWDIPMAQWFYDSGGQGFVWREHWFFTRVMHGGSRILLWLLVIYVFAAASLPQSIRTKAPLLGSLPRPALWSLVVMLLLPPVWIGLIKSQSLPFCPWDEIGFGGRYPHYEWWQALTLEVTSKWGHCWPAGHASGGFGLLGLYFFARQFFPTQANKVLFFAMLIGFGLGIVQQIRGAHFMSHTLWTAWFAWLICGLAAYGLNQAAWLKTRREG